MSGQLEVVNGGAPFVYFDLGDGKCATCNPISEPDLAAALVDTIADKAKENALWNLGALRRAPCTQEQGRTQCGRCSVVAPSIPSPSDPSFDEREGSLPDACASRCANLGERLGAVTA